MPTRWTINESMDNIDRSFRMCDRRSNQSCVLSDDNCLDIDNVTGIDIKRDDYHKDRKNDTNSQGWRLEAWYYLHLHEAKNISEINLKFGAETADRHLRDNGVSLCDNVSLPPFGTVKSHVPVEDTMRHMRDQFRIDTFRFSGKELLYFHPIHSAFRFRRVLYSIRFDSVLPQKYKICMHSCKK